MGFFFFCLFEAQALDWQSMLDLSFCRDFQFSIVDSPCRILVVPLFSFRKLEVLRGRPSMIPMLYDAVSLEVGRSVPYLLYTHSAQHIVQSSEAVWQHHRNDPDPPLKWTG